MATYASLKHRVDHNYTAATGQSVLPSGATRCVEGHVYEDAGVWPVNPACIEAAGLGARGKSEMKICETVPRPQNWLLHATLLQP